MANKNRDRFVNQSLRRAGWCVVRIWESALRNDPMKTVNRLRRALDDDFRSGSESVSCDFPTKDL
jgi:G:T-mismatch repair DNA endonuclease (very short patch repair protein)